MVCTCVYIHICIYLHSQPMQVIKQSWLGISFQHVCKSAIHAKLITISRVVRCLSCIAVCMPVRMNVCMHACVSHSCEVLVYEPQNTSEEAPFASCGRAPSQPAQWIPYKYPWWIRALHTKPRWRTLVEPQTGKASWWTYLWLVGNGGMVVIVVIIVPHSSIPYYLNPIDPL